VESDPARPHQERYATPDHLPCCSINKQHGNGTLLLQVPKVILPLRRPCRHFALADGGATKPIFRDAISVGGRFLRKTCAEP